MKWIITRVRFVLSVGLRRGNFSSKRNRVRSKKHGRNMMLLVLPQMRMAVGIRWLIIYFSCDSQQLAANRWIHMYTLAGVAYTESSLQCTQPLRASIHGHDFNYNYYYLKVLLPFAHCGHVRLVSESSRWVRLRMRTKTKPANYSDASE